MTSSGEKNNFSVQKIIIIVIYKNNYNYKDEERQK